MSAGFRTTALAGVVAAISAFGLVSAWMAYGPGGHLARLGASNLWILDLLTGLVLMACGALVVRRRPTTFVGQLLLLASLAWFAATLVGSSRSASSVMSPSVEFVYRGFIAHILVTYPTGRPADRVEWLAVCLGYALSFLAPVWHSPSSGLVLVGLLVAITWRGYRHAHGQTKDARRDALGVALLFALTVLIMTVGYLPAVGVPDRFRVVLDVGLYLALMAGVVRLTTRLVRSNQAALTDFVVELGEVSPTTLGGELARLLDDPTVRIGTWSSAAAGYVDEAGQVVLQTRPEGGEAGLRVDQDGRPAAFVQHQPGILDDPALRRAVADAVRLAVANDRLREQVHLQVGQLSASRRRFILAGDDAGQRLARRVHEGAMGHLATVDLELRTAMRAVDAGAHASTRSAIGRAQERLERVREDLRDFALGLYPLPLRAAGLASGLADLARQSPVPVHISIDDVAALPIPVSIDAYLVCAEALANVAKHAGAATVRLEASVDAGELHMEIVDDGVGGASVEGGSGLRGLVDRVESLGGSLMVSSPPGVGTRLTAMWPLDRIPGDSKVKGRIVETRRNELADPLVSPDATPVVQP